MVCTFFGHRDTPESIQPVLHHVLTELIEKQGVNTFYIGNQGSFDRMANAELKKLKEIYPHIRYTVVLAYMPQRKNGFPVVDYSNTMYPDGLESVPLKFAIDKRNRMMVEWSDVAVTYVCCPVGGAAKFKALAEKKGKQVIELQQKCP